MAISTFAELQTAMANWLNRTDLTSRLPEFITLAEADINRSTKLTEGYTSDATLSCSSRFTNLPSGYRQIDRVVFLDGSIRRPLTYIGTDQAGYDNGLDVSNKPKFYSVRGGQLELIPAPSSAITILISYWSAPAALSSSAHAFFLQNPDLYLYRALLEAAIYMQDTVRIEYYRNLYSALFDQVTKQEKDQRFASGLTMRRA